MLGLSLREAAKEAGVSKSTIFRAIKNGRLSAARDDDGNFSIQASELFRVYPRNTAGTAPTAHRATGSDAPSETAALKAENEGLRAQLSLMREMADGWRQQAEVSQRLLAGQRPRRGLFGWFRAAS